MIENHSIELFSLNKAWEPVAAAVRETLVQNGFQVVQSFDLQLARASHEQCSCPYHGTELCDCQMIVLLIYGIQEAPTSLVAHGHDGWTHLSLVDSPQQRISPEALEIIKEVLSPGKLEVSMPAENKQRPANHSNEEER